MGNCNTKKKNKAIELSKIIWHDIFDYLNDNELIICSNSCLKLRNISNDCWKSRIMELQIIENELIDDFENIVIHETKKKELNKHFLKIKEVIMDNHDIWRNILVLYHIIEMRLTNEEIHVKNIDALKKCNMFFDFIYTYVNSIGHFIYCKFENKLWINAQELFIAFIKLLFFQISLYSKLEKKIDIENNFFIINKNNIILQSNNNNNKITNIFKYDIFNWTKLLTEIYKKIEDDIYWINVKKIQNYVQNKKYNLVFEICEGKGCGKNAWSFVQKLKDYNDDDDDNEDIKNFKIKKIILCNSFHFHNDSKYINNNNEKYFNEDKIYIPFDYIINIIK